jgi:2-keto-4-pentenoate hydratase/2-oxohepta-3-ene-1,7-dioic acid hydratase in catechol pathway
MGPVLVTADEIPDPQTLSIRTRVNDRVMQDSSTRHMIFGVAELVAFLSRTMTLEPGDVVSTGTPAGVGVFRNPPVFLQPGDVMRIEVEKIGVLENAVVEDL